jgi:predicted alpha/beta hydrolase
MENDTFTLTSSDSTPLVLNRYPARGTPRAALLFSPALGMRASYYPFFANALAALGVTVWVNEQRGHGEHPLRASHRCNYGYHELVEHDLRTAAQQLRSQNPGLPLIVGGHSLGGQLSALLAAAHPDEVDGILLIASGTTHFRNFAPLTAAQILIGSQLLFRPTAAVLGHYPGSLFGFGGREARRLMRDWAHLARTSRFDPNGSTRDYESLLRDVTQPVLSVTVRKDPFAPLAAARALTAKMPRSALTEVALPAIVPKPHPSNHAAWARQPDAVASVIDNWLKKSGLADRLK